MICYIIRGLSGSGKSTLAQALAFGAGIESRPKGYICSADDYFMVGNEYKFDARLLGEAHRKCFSKFLNLVRSKASVVIIDNTNVTYEEVVRYSSRARKEGYVVKVVEPDNEVWVTISNKLNSGVMPTDSELAPLAVRNVHGVTLDIIKRRLKVWIPHAELVKKLEAAYVEPNPELPSCILVDIDGTVAVKGARSAYDWANVGADTRNESVINLLIGIIANNYGGYRSSYKEIIFFSGRDGVCFPESRKWLDENGFKDCPLYMREPNDQRKDSIIKRELFDKHIRGKYNVLCVFDDRDQVVDMWRNELGLDCFQVQEGDF